jgi:hypothetical protein
VLVKHGGQKPWMTAKVEARWFRLAGT